MKSVLKFYMSVNCCNCYSTCIMELLHVVHARIQDFSSGGVQVRLTKKALTAFFFFLVLRLFYRSQMVNFKENLSFFKVPEGVQHFPEGVQLFPGGGGGPIAYSL